MHSCREWRLMVARQVKTTRPLILELHLMWKTI